MKTRKAKPVDTCAYCGKQGGSAVGTSVVHDGRTFCCSICATMYARYNKEV